MPEILKAESPETTQRTVDLIKNGGAVVVPTDVTYEIVCHASSPEAVERVFNIKQRDSSKPLVILINNTGDLYRYNLIIPGHANAIMNRYWPGKLTILFPSLDGRFSYLHKNTPNLSFRMPDDPWLKGVMEQTGPLIATTANLPGESSAKTAEKAVASFGDQVDLYVDAGELAGKPATVISIDDRKINIIKQGSVLVEVLQDPGF